MHPPYFIIGNFGNHSLAVVQFIILSGLKNCHFLSVNTGFSSDEWLKHQEAASLFTQNHGIDVHLLRSPRSFAELVQDRKQFPSKKFQWCAGFLKGLVLQDKLDELDPDCAGIIVSGKRRKDSLKFSQLEEYEEQSEYYQGRTIWHPLLKTNEAEMKSLVLQTGFSWQTTPSQECSPCIHTPEAQLSILPLSSKSRLQSLEEEIGMTLFSQPIKDYTVTMQSCFELDSGYFDSGCGSPWNCGE